MYKRQVLAALTVISAAASPVSLQLPVTLVLSLYLGPGHTAPFLQTYLISVTIESGLGVGKMSLTLSLPNHELCHPLKLS